VRFLDTTILLYSVSTDPRDLAKRAIAETLLRATDLCLSVQVMQEFHAQATRSTRLGALTDDQAERFLIAIRRYPVLDNTVAVLDAALAIRRRWPLSIWDAMIVASAVSLDCTEVLTEDLQHCALIAGVRITNPFV
jgi:predicted nucleic acid-binding protein